MGLADDINAAILEDADKRHLGKTRESLTLTRRERLIADSIERFVQAQRRHGYLDGLHDRRFDTLLKLHTPEEA